MTQEELFDRIDRGLITLDKMIDRLRSADRKSMVTEADVIRVLSAVRVPDTPAIELRRTVRCMDCSVEVKGATPGVPAICELCLEARR